MPLYSAVLLGSAIIPLIFSFDKKVWFFQYWKSLFPAMIITGSLFIAADVFFVRKGIWGFNPAYHSGILILGLPLEEWLFFIFIPYACVFTHYVFISYFPFASVGKTTGNLISAIIILSLVIVVILNWQKSYTVFIFTILIISIIAAAVFSKDLLNRFYLSFLVILIPFFLVNSLLTGTFIREPVFWYDETQILGLRIISVPIEDAGFAFSLVLLNLLIMCKLQRYTHYRNQKV
jgi:lycopene cyclase domain-containing protein